MQRHCKDQLQCAVIFHCPGYKPVQRGAHKHVSVVCPMWWGFSGQQARPGQLLSNSGGKLALSVFLLGLLNVRTTLLMFITSQLHDGFCALGIKPHLPTYLLQRENRRQRYLYQKTKSFPRPPANVASQQQSHRTETCHSILSSSQPAPPHHVSCASLSLWIPLP